MKSLKIVHTNCLVIKNLGVTSIGVFSSELPHVKERFPVNEVQQAVQVVPLKNTGAQELRAHWKTNTHTVLLLLFYLLFIMTCMMTPSPGLGTDDQSICRAFSLAWLRDRYWRS